MKNWLKQALLLLGWAVSVVAVYYGVMRVDFGWNFLNWSGSTESLVEILWWVLALSGNVAIFFLARVTSSRVAQVVALVFVLLILWLAISILPAEPLSGGFLGRSRGSPVWFRLVNFGFLSLPCVFWLIACLKHWRKAQKVILS